jgi:hypothetical protein
MYKACVGYIYTPYSILLVSPRHYFYQLVLSKLYASFINQI